MVDMEKRDNTLDNKMRFIHNLPGAANKAGAPTPENVVETVYSQITVTKTPGVPEPVDSHTTPAAPAPTNKGGDAAAAAKSKKLAEQQASYESAKSLAQAPNTSPAAKSTQDSNGSVQSSRTTIVTSSSVAVAAVGGTPIQTTRQTNPVVGTPVQHTRGPSAVVGTPISATDGAKAVIGQKSDGMSTGAKAGLAIGILLIIALAAGLVFFCWRRRQQKSRTEGAEQLDEKRATKDSFFGGSSAAAARGPQRESVQSEKSFHSTRTAATAPRLSLRPVTQFLPNILGGEKNATTNGNLGVPAMSEKPRSNPFDDSAALSEKQSPSNPFEDGEGAIAATATTPGHSQQNSWEGTEPPTPKSTKFGTAAAVAITSAGGSNGAQAPRGPNNVHRVQLDFKPSMEDELELRSGQLVRMVHEYDDGWVRTTLDRQ